MGTCSCRCLVFTLVFIALTILAATRTDASNYTWTGTGGSSWSTSGNWSPSGPPSSSGGTTLAFTGSGIYSGNLVNDTGTFSLGQLTFASDAPAIQLTGSALAFAVTNGGICQASPGIVTIDNVISWTGGNTLVLNVAGGGGLVLNGSIGSGGSLNKAGSGTLTLTNTNNNYTGGTTISAGTVGFANGALGLSGTINFGGGVLQFLLGNTQDVSGRFAGNQPVAIDTGGNNITFAAALTGTGGCLTKYGLGALTLSGSNDYGGGTTISAGTLVATSPSAVPGYSTALKVTVANGGMLTLNAGGSGWMASSISGLLNSNSGGFAAGSNLGIDTTAASLTYSNGITGSMGLALLGSNTLTLTGSNTYSGPTTISAGTLQIGDGTTGHDGSVSSSGGIVNNAALVYDLFGPQTFSGTISGSGSLTKSGASTLILGASNSFSGTTTISNGTLNLSNSGALQGSTVVVPIAGSIVFDQSVASNTFAFGGLGGSGGLSLQSTAPITLTVGGNNGDTIYSGALSGSGSLIKAGVGTLTLTGSNNYGGGTTVSAGALAVTNPTVLPGYSSSSTVTVGNGGMLALNVGGTGWAASSMSTLLSVNGNGFAPGSTLGIDANNGNFPYSISIAGNMGLAKFGSNTLTLSAGNTFTGLTSIYDGTLNLSHSSALQASTVVTSTAGSLAFDSSVSNHAFTFGGLSGSGNLSLQNTASAAIALTVGGNNSSTTYAGVLSATGSLLKTGSGTLTLTGSNTYTGPTTITSGALQLGDGSNGHDGLLANTGGIVNNAALIYDLSGLQTYSGAISGSGSLLKIGAGTLTLAGSNNYSGGTTVSAGVLAVPNTAALPNYGTNSAVTVASGATLTLNAGGMGWAASSISGLLTSNSGGFAAGSNLGIDTSNGSLPYANSIAGAMGLAKFGSNTLTLSNGNAFTGLTSVSGGTLVLSNSGALQASTVVAPTAGSIAFDSGVTSNTFAFGGLSGLGNLSLQNTALAPIALTVGGNNGSTTYGGVLSGSGSLTKLGNGTLTLTGSNTYTGVTTISGGTLQIGNGSSGNDGLLAAAGGIANNAALVYNLSGSQTYSGVISGSGTLTKAGGGILTLASANTFSGATAISGGALNLSNGNALQTSTVVAPTAGSITFDPSVSGNAFTFGGLSGAGNLSLQNTAAVTLTVGGNNAYTIYSGSLSGSGSLTKAGTGKLTLTGSNTYAGATTISGGTLQLGDGTYGHDGSLSPSGGITDNAMLTYNLNGAQSYSGTISGAGALTKTGNGTLTLSATNNSYSSGTTVSGGTLVVPSAGALANYNAALKVAVSGGATLTLPVGGAGWTASNIYSLLTSNSGGFAAGSNLGIDTTAASLTYSNGITGSMGLALLGSNTLTLTGPNTYSGSTTISAGTLQIGDGNSGHDGSLSSSVAIVNNAAIFYDLYGSQTYSGILSGIGTLTKTGNGTLILSASNSFSGTTTVASGTLTLSNSSALQASTVVTSTAGSLAFDSSVSNHAFTFGGLSGSGNLSLQNTASAAIALTVGGNNDSTTYGGVLSGSGSLTKLGNGTLTLTSSNSYTGGTSVAAGALTVASAGSLTAAAGRNLYVGTSSPAAMTIQDNAAVSVGGELDVNELGSTAGNPSTLTITGGWLSVSGPTVVGRGTVSGPSTTNAAVYQSGGTATLGGLVTVGSAGTAMCLYDIDGGTLAAASGLVVGSSGNGLLYLHGAGTATVSGGQGLVVGQDASLATVGSVQLASGALSVTGNLTLGSSGGMGTLNLTGGSLSVVGSGGGNLVVGGFGMLIVDDTIAAAGLSFGGSLTHSGSGLLVVVPQNGHLSSTESVGFTVNPMLVNGILGPWAVAQISGTDTRGDYLTVSSSGGHLLTTASYADFGGTTTGNSVVSITGTQTPNANKSAYVVKVGSGSIATLSSTNTLSLLGGGIIMDGGTVTGGTVDCSGSAAMIYAGGISGTIASTIKTSSGLTKFGPGTLVLMGTNNGTLSGPVVVAAGTLNVQRFGALGVNGATVAAGAAIELQGGVQVANKLTLNGSGVGGGGVLRSVTGNNTVSGNVTLGSDALINTIADQLTLSGSLSGSLGGTYTLTKTGSGTLVLSTSNDSLASLVISGGTLQVPNAGALTTATVNNGATLALVGGALNLPNVPLTLNGVGGGVGALWSRGVNYVNGPVTLAGDSQVSVDGNADKLTIWGSIGGNFALTKAGSGNLALFNTANSFTGALSILSGTLSVDSLSVSNSGSELGPSNAPLLLGSDSQTATFLYTGAASTTTTRAFTLAAGGSGAFSVNSSLTLSGPIGGNGNLVKSGSGQLVLSGTSTYTGTTTVSAGTLSINPSGSIGGSSGIMVNRGAVLQVTGSSGQLPDSGNLTLGGGTLNVVSAAPGVETAGALMLNAGQNAVCTSNTGGGTSYLMFASGPSAPAAGATVNLLPSGSSAPIQLAANPGSLNNILGGYAFFGGTDFVARYANGSGGPYTLGAWNYSPSATGNLATITNPTLDVQASGTQGTIGNTEFNSLYVSASTSVTSTGTLTLDTGGLILGNNSSLSGGTLHGSASGELVLNTPTGTNLSTISSIIADNGGPTALVKTGSATVLLSNSANSYTGDTFVNAGTLKIYAISGTTSTTVASGAVLQANFLKQHQLTIAAGGKVILGGVSGGIGSSGERVGGYASESYAAGSYVGGGATPIPEPGTLVLLLMGMVVLLTVGPVGWRKAGSSMKYVVRAANPQSPIPNPYSPVGGLS